MGMFSEINAGANKALLEKIILNAIFDSHYGDIRSAVKGFAKRELYEWYIAECNDLFEAPNPLIVKHFGEFKK